MVPRILFVLTFFRRILRERHKILFNIIIYYYAYFVCVCVIENLLPIIVFAHSSFATLSLCVDPSITLILYKNMS